MDLCTMHAEQNERKAWISTCRMQITLQVTMNRCKQIKLNVPSCMSMWWMMQCAWICGLCAGEYKCIRIYACYVQNPHPDTNKAEKSNSNQGIQEYKFRIQNRHWICIQFQYSISRKAENQEQLKISAYLNLTLTWTWSLNQIEEEFLVLFKENTKSAVNWW